MTEYCPQGYYDRGDRPIYHGTHREFEEERDRLERAFRRLKCELIFLGEGKVGKSFPFTIPDWILFSGNYILDFYHDFDNDKLQIEIFRDISGVLKQVDVNESGPDGLIKARISVPADPDLRFDGRANIIQIGV